MVIGIAMMALYLKTDKVKSPLICKTGAGSGGGGGYRPTMTTTTTTTPLPISVCKESLNTKKHPIPKTVLLHNNSVIMLNELKTLKSDVGLVYVRNWGPN